LGSFLFLKCKLPNRISFDVFDGGASAKLKRVLNTIHLRYACRGPRGRHFARGLAFI